MLFSVFLYIFAQRFSKNNFLYKSMVLNRLFLNALLSANTPSGYEDEGTVIFNDYCSSFAKHIYDDAIGNSCFAVGDGDIPFLISGHIDEIALQVQNIDDKGFIHFIKDGGIDPKVLLGCNVTILCQENHKVKGVIGKAPIHIEHKSEDKDKVIKIKDMKIDCGFQTKEEAMEYVSVGDMIIVNSPIIDLGPYRISSRGLDDKIGVFITAEVLRVLSKHKLNKLKVFGASCVQEEVGAVGATIIAKNINPKYSIDYDVTFATDDGYVSADEWGDIQLGKGGAIAHGTDCNPKFVKFIQDVCKEKEIPCQNFSAPNGGTNTLHIKQGASDCQTALISIPNRNMHTQVEICDFRDIQAIIDMTIATILKLDASL